MWPIKAPRKRGAVGPHWPAGGLRPASAARPTSTKLGARFDDGWDHPAMGIWSHEGKLYEVASCYALPEDAWHYELSGLTGAPGTGPYLTVAIPDATPDGPFTPRPAQHVIVQLGGGTVPWRILEHLIELLDSSGDLVDELRDLSAGATALPLTRNEWSHESRQFEVNTFHHGAVDSWCYELYEVKPADGSNDFIDVRIPDASPESGPFVPVSADHVTLTMHGQWTVPWPVFRRFIDAIQASGDIVESVPGSNAEPNESSAVERP